MPLAARACRELPARVRYARCLRPARRSAARASPARHRLPLRSPRSRTPSLLDRLLQAFKYGGRLSHADFFAEALSASVAQRPVGMPWPDALVALPLAPARQRARGFDQAAEIARRVARITGVTMAAGLRRTRDTPAQAALPWKERAKNVRGAFAADPSLGGRRIAIVDDVMTTGATLASAAGAVLRAGAVGVEAWAVARTLPPAQLL